MTSSRPEINGVTYVGNQMTFNLDTEAPYDWLWWNGSPNVQKWESVTGGVYNDSWALAAGDEMEDFELILSKASDGSYNYEFGETSGKVSVAKGVITFDSEITPSYRFQRSAYGCCYKQRVYGTCHGGW